ncbi:hypothetical protein GGX14DRAFT_573701 [Mycena pura]|uniref:Uncharacterized protein n=1 Tax=Mycena pura TaxID=153505 RepID=A0AAD6V197_9AGAR|nr:hypothetical protein GGX14DRAFT_573701 [Mycena pura]
MATAVSPAPDTDSCVKGFDAKVSLKESRIRGYYTSVPLRNEGLAPAERLGHRDTDAKWMTLQQEIRLTPNAQIWPRSLNADTGGATGADDIYLHLWLSLVAGLGQRLLLDLPPRDTLLTYSAEELIAEVKRVVIGPETWAANSPRPPTIHRQLHLPISKPGPGDNRPPILLTGGRSLLVCHGSRCEIWNVAGAYREWAREKIIRVDAQSLPNEDKIMISLECFTAPLRVRLEVLTLDLNTGCVNEVVSLKLPVEIGQMDLPVVYEDFIAHRIHWDGDGGGILVINWRERSFVIIILPGSFTSHAFFRGHLLVPGNGGVLVYSLASFQSLWRPLTRFVVPAYHSQRARPRPIIQQTFEPLGSEDYTAIMAVHHSLLHSDRCIVSIYCYGRGWSSYFRYRFTVAASRELQNWQPISSSISTKMISMRSLSYAGYGPVSYEGARCVCRAFGDRDRYVSLLARKPIFLSEYSGADGAPLTHQPMIIGVQTNKSDPLKFQPNSHEFYLDDQ